MKTIQNSIILLLLIIAPQAFAEKMLIPPDDTQDAECHQIYARAAQPKTASNIYNGMNARCQQKGGLRIMHKILQPDNAKTPFAYAYTCIGDTPNDVIFSCSFSTSYGDI